MTTRSDQLQIRELMEQALACYCEEHSDGVPAQNDYDDPLATAYHVDGSTVTLSEGTWYQPALAVYDGHLGRFEAQLQGDHDLFFDVCTKVRGLPYRQKSFSVDPNFEQPARIFSSLYSIHHLRAVSDYRQATLGDLVVYLEQVDRQHGGGTYAANAASNLKLDFNLGYQSVSPVYPTSMGFVVDGQKWSPNTHQPKPLMS